MRSFAVLVLLLEGASGSWAAETSRQTLLLAHVAADVVRVRSAAALEWWSIGVHAIDNRGRRYAISATYFRFTLSRRDALYTAEVSVLDEMTGHVVSAERSRRALFADRESRSVTLSIDDWFLAARSVRSTSVVVMRASSRDRRIGVALTLVPRKPAVRSLAAGGISITRLAASGIVMTNGQRLHVTGTAWLDHDAEASTPSRPRIGWTRFELQLDDGRDVELFASRLLNDCYWLPSMLREQESLSSNQVTGGILEPIGGFIVSKAGHVTKFSMSQLSLVLRANTLWRSPHDEAVYPSLWWLSLGRGDPPIAIAPDALDQEMLPSPTGVAIYAGAVDLAEAEPPGRHLGVGFVQLTGYAMPTSM